jgi:hypothetical protein
MWEFTRVLSQDWRHGQFMLRMVLCWACSRSGGPRDNAWQLEFEVGEDNDVDAWQGLVNVFTAE